MKYLDYEAKWQWEAIEMPMERGEGTWEVEEEDPLSKKEQWFAILMPGEE